MSGEDHIVYAFAVGLLLYSLIAIIIPTPNRHED